MAGILSKNTTLGYKKGSGDSYTVISGLQSFPDMGSVPESVETTTLADGVKTYIDGLQDYGDMEFECLYIKDEFEALQALKGEDLAWQVKLPDGTLCDWNGMASVILSGTGTNDALTYKISIKASSEIEWS